MGERTPAMYDELAAWWPLLSPPEEYVEEAAFFRDLILDTARSPIRTMLELGSGGGSNASHLKQWFSPTLVDPSPGMLDVSRRLNPECEHIQGDMRTVRLAREFDCVFVHDAVCYMTTPEALQQAIATAAVHCREGGVVLFAPDFVRETFRDGTDCGGTDAAGEGLRYLEWCWDPDPADCTYRVEYALMVRTADGGVRAVHDRHVEGLFSRAEWTRWLEEAGFVVREASPPDTDATGQTQVVFVGRKDG